MNFELDEAQSLIRETAQRYLRDRYAFETRRNVARGEPGWDPNVWDGLAQMGLLGVLQSEDLGGAGGGAVEMMILMEAFGEALLLEPFLESVVVGGALLARSPSRDARRLLGDVATGEARLAVGWAEPGGRYDAAHVSTRARREAGGWVIDGAKSVVTAAPWATHLLVSARTSGDVRDAWGVSLFVVPAAAAGVSLRAYRTIDDRRAADVFFSGVRLGPDALVSEIDDGLTDVERALDWGAAAVCAEAVGVMRRLLADTIAYTQQRRQFGQPLSSFQALQHRMADMYIAVEEAISATLLAVLNLEETESKRARAVSAAKATIGRTARFVGQNAVQLHGAMGMTDDLPVSHYFRRLTAIESEFGSADHHLARYAALMEPRARDLQACVAGVAPRDGLADA